MNSWRQSVKAHDGVRSVASDLAKSHIIKKPVMKSGKIIKKAITKP